MSSEHHIPDPTPVEISPKDEALKRIMRSSARAAQQMLLIGEQLGDAREQVFQKTAQLQELEERLSKARIDKLTGLPDREAFEGALESLLSRNHGSNVKIGIALADAKHLKIHNGHGKDRMTSGDNYIRAGAEAINEVRRESDTLFRFGGDELALLMIMQNTDGQEHEDEIASRLELGANEKLHQTNELLDSELPRHLSFGVVIGEDGESAEDLITRAGIAVEEASLDYYQNLDPDTLSLLKQFKDERFGDTAAKQIPTVPPHAA